MLICGSLLYSILLYLTVNGVSKDNGPLYTTALLFTTHEMYTFLNKKNVICVFFDYRKAFNSVPHRRLMDRLFQIGFHPWICNYLSNKQHVVLVNGDPQLFPQESHKAQF